MRSVVVSPAWMIRSAARSCASKNRPLRPFPRQRGGGGNDRDLPQSGAEARLHSPDRRQDVPVDARRALSMSV
jgi:hypothetical protein